MFLFLDIDGVLIPATTWKSPVNMEDGFPMFIEKATKALQTLISEDTTVVLTTSHRDRFTIAEWKDIFKKRGLTVSNLNRLDSNREFKKRKDEILAWFGARYQGRLHHY